MRCTAAVTGIVVKLEKYKEFQAWSSGGWLWDCFDIQNHTRANHPTLWTSSRKFHKEIGMSIHSALTWFGQGANWSISFLNAAGASRKRRTGSLREKHLPLYHVFWEKGMEAQRFQEKIILKFHGLEMRWSLNICITLTYTRFLNMCFLFSQEVNFSKTYAFASCATVQWSFHKARYAGEILRFGGDRWDMMGCDETQKGYETPRISEENSGFSSPSCTSVDWCWLWHEIWGNHLHVTGAHSNCTVKW